MSSGICSELGDMLYHSGGV
ncbi:unnamed protein product [Linum tenue]|uniref:Uncharacterized protein n=1 Tax=Linum tenue TaxID=586396 RepID=A0AAV0I3I2_9ROSI|nr:unnamed protein product [Linum tenue]